MKRTEKTAYVVGIRLQRVGVGLKSSDQGGETAVENNLPPPHPSQLVFMAVVVEGGLALLAVGLGVWLDRPPLEMIRWTWLGAAWGVAAGLPLLVGLVALVRLPWGPLVRLTRLVDEMIVPLFRECRLVELAVIAALAGLGEEMLFRGIVQVTIAEWFGGTLGTPIGIAAAAILFGLLHPITTSYAILAGLVGVYLGWFFAATENLLVPIVAHGVYDFFALVYLVRLRSPSAGNSDT